MDQFNDYINSEVAPAKHLPKDWVFNDLTVKLSFKFIYLKSFVKIFEILRKKCVK